MKVWLVEEIGEETSVKVYGSHESAARAMKKLVFDLVDDLTDGDYDVDIKWYGDSAQVETWASTSEYRIEEREVLI